MEYLKSNSGRSHTVRITLGQGPKLSATQVILQLARGNTHELEIESPSGL